jgi:hypothetical protein
MRLIGCLLGILCWGSVALAQGQEPKVVLWWDATANLIRVQSPQSIGCIFDKCVAAGIDTIVFDVKPLVGDVLYNSAVADRLLEWKGIAAPQGFDPLAAAVEAAHARGLKILASVNVFSEGHKYFRRGFAYQHPELQCVAYDLARRLVFPDGDVRIDAFNRRPGDEEVTLTPSTGSEAMLPSAGTLLVSVDGKGCVTAVIDGEMAAEGVAIPRGGYALAAGTAAREGIARRVDLGAALDVEATPDLKPIADADCERIACFVNPILPEVRQRELAIINEIAAGYDIDGIVFDRMRYSGYATDFSEASRRAFEADLGHPIERFPEDILTFSPITGEVEPGPLYARWATWRARNIKDFLAEARKVVKAARPSARVCVYVGAWYDEYEGVGVNWAREGSPPPSERLGDDYAETGYANLCDLIFAGCYYRPVTAADLPQGIIDPLHTVSGAARRAVEVVGDASRVIGSIYLDMYGTDGEQMKRALHECINVTGGVMLFDLVHVETQGFWDEIQSALAGVPCSPPAADTPAAKQ